MKIPFPMARHIGCGHVLGTTSPRRCGCMTIAISINMITKGNMGNMAPMHMPLSMNRNDAASTPTRNEKNGVRCGNVCAGMRGPMADGEWGMGNGDHIGSGEEGAQQERGIHQGGAVHEVLELENIRWEGRHRTRYWTQTIGREGDAMSTQQMEGMPFFDRTEEEFCRSSRRCVPSPLQGRSAGIMHTNWSYCFRTTCYAD